MRVRRSLPFTALLLLLASGGRVAAQEDPAALVAQLASDSAQVRSDAYNKLMRARSPETMALLGRALPTMPLAGQSFAVYLLEAYQGNDAVAVWKKLSGQGGAFVQAAAAASLWRRGDKSTGQALAAAVTAATAAERTYVLGRLYGIEDAAVTAAVRGLVRVGAEQAALADALNHLLQWQKGRDAETVQAAEALLGGDEAAAAVGLAYLVAAGEGSKHGAALAVAITKETLSLHQWMRFLERAARLDAVLTEAIAARLERVKSEHDIGRLVPLLQKHAPHRLEPALRGHLDGDDPKLRAAALKALAGVPGALDAKKFREMLGSEDNQVVLVAADTLRRMDDLAGLDRVITLVAKAAKDKAEAVRVLGGFRDPRAVPPLLDAFADADVQVRRAAVTALQQLLPDLFPYRRFDFERAGCRADGPDPQRAEGLRLLRAWWDERK